MPAIDSLPVIGTPTGNDVLPIVQGNVTYKVSLDQITAEMSEELSCRVATTANLTATYDNGSSGIGSTLTNAGALAALSIDSVSLSVGDRVLVKDQSSQQHNGIYQVTVVGDGATAWVMTRETAFDESDEFAQGDFFTVGAGTTNARTQWIQTAAGPFTIGTTPITFESNVVAGTGITKTNNTVALTTPVSMANGGSGRSLTASNGGIVYTDADSMEVLAGTATAGQTLRSSASAAPTWSTATYANTYTINSILYASSANTIVGLTSGANKVLTTDASSVPTYINFFKGTTAAYGGGGTSNAFVATGLTSSSTVSAVIRTSTNNVSIVKAVPSVDTLTVTFSADPGANTTVDYIAMG